MIYDFLDSPCRFWGHSQSQLEKRRRNPVSDCELVTIYCNHTNLAIQMKIVNNLPRFWYPKSMKRLPWDSAQKTAQDARFRWWIEALFLAQKCLNSRLYCSPLYQIWTQREKWRIIILWLIKFKHFLNFLINYYEIMIHAISSTK